MILYNGEYLIENQDKPIKIYKSSINEKSILQYNQRFGRSGKILFIYGFICLIVSLSFLSFILIINLIFVGQLFSAFIAIIIAGVIICSIAYYFIISKKDPQEESKKFYIETFKNYLVLNSGVSDSITIEYSKIIKIKRYHRDLKIFSDNDIDVYLEQKEYPYIHIATNNENLYSIIISEFNSNGKKFETEYILDIDDINLFKKIVFEHN